VVGVEEVPRREVEEDAHGEGRGEGDEEHDHHLHGAEGMCGRASSGLRTGGWLQGGCGTHRSLSI